MKTRKELAADLIRLAKILTVASRKTKKAAGGLGLQEGAIATHLDVMQQLLQKGDLGGLKKRVKELEAELGRVKGAAVSKKADLDSFFRAYVEAALWSSTDESTPSGGEPLDQNYTEADINEDTLGKMKDDCEAFVKANKELLSYVRDDQAGHDFWLSRNGHGAGFFDLEEGKDLDSDAPPGTADKLQAAAEAFGEYNLYIGDDGEIHGS